MTALSHHQLAKGRDRFLQDHPVVKARIDALTIRELGYPTKNSLKAC